MLEFSRKSIAVVSLTAVFAGIGTTIAPAASARYRYFGPLPGGKCISRGPTFPAHEGKALIAPVACVPSSLLKGKVTASL
jgi:hypothetical protein